MEDWYEEVLELTLAGTMVNVRAHERPWEVEATPEAVMAVVNFCLERLEDEPIILKKEERAAALQDVSASASASASSSSALVPAVGFSLSTPNSLGVQDRVTWHPSVEAWAVHFKNRQGKRVQKRLLVRLPKKFEQEDIQIATAAKMERRRELFREACLLWNREDMSSRDRIEI